MFSEVSSSPLQQMSSEPPLVVVVSQLTAPPCITAGPFGMAAAKRRDYWIRRRAVPLRLCSEWFHDETRPRLGQRRQRPASTPTRTPAVVVAVLLHERRRRPEL